VDIREFILQAIKKLLLPELEDLQKELKAAGSKQEEILGILSKMQSEIVELRERLARVEGKYENVAETVLAQVENKSLKGLVIRLLSRRK
jgi:predicted  nucleic acid-binding Zn-ribbon protein